MASHMGWRKRETTPSMAWVRASMPVAAVSLAGRRTVRRGSRMATAGYSGAVDDHELARARGVLDDGDVRRLAAGAGGGGDGHHGEAGRADLVGALPALEIAAVARQQRHRLAGVERAPAADRDDAVGADRRASSAPASTAPLGASASARAHTARTRPPLASATRSESPSMATRGSHTRSARPTSRRFR